MQRQCLKCYEVLKKPCPATAVKKSGAARLPERYWSACNGARGRLIADEAQHLTLDAVEELRYLHDNSRTGLVFAGNEKVHSQLIGEVRVRTAFPVSVRVCA